MLVWKSMTLMMSPILRELSLVIFIVSTTWLTTWPPLMATVKAFCANWLAWRALSALWETVEPSSSKEAAVCYSALA